MYILPTTVLYTREVGPGLSQQNVIIIAVCCSVGGVVLAFVLWRSCRRSSQSVPLPPPQALAHHREQQLAQLAGSAPRVATWYEPQLSANDHFRPNSFRGSKAPLLGKEAFSPSPSLPTSTETVQDMALQVDDSHNYLPPPSASFFQHRPGSSSSLGSSNASCRTLPLSPDSASPFLGSAPTSRTRPLSMSSQHTHRTTMSARRGVPHAPHNQIQIVLPTPLSSANNSVETLARPRSRYGAEGGDRRSAADPWINIGSGNNSLLVETEPARRRRASMGMPTQMYPVPYEDQDMVPGGPPHGDNASESPPAQGGAARNRKLEKRRG